MAAATIKIQFEGKKIRIGGTYGALTFATSQMLFIGSFANKTVKDRTRSGVGSDDSVFPPLSNVEKFVRTADGRIRYRLRGYAAWKAAHGLAPIRDMWGAGTQGGHMLDNSTVRYADSNTVKISFTARMARIKALANEKRTPFYSFSGEDTKKIMDYAAKLWQSNVKQVISVLTGRRKAA